MSVVKKSCFYHSEKEAVTECFKCNTPICYSDIRENPLRRSGFGLTPKYCPECFAAWIKKSLKILAYSAIIANVFGVIITYFLYEYFPPELLIFLLLDLGLFIYFMNLKKLDYQIKIDLNQLKYLSHNT